jgi:hypothetical protein
MDETENKTMLAIRIIHTAIIIAVVIYAIMLYIFIPYIDLRVFSSDDPTLTMVQIALGITGIITLAIGYFLPRLASKWNRRSQQSLISTHLQRISLFNAIGIYGLILGILGAKPVVSLLFLVVSALALILTFPTAEKWRTIVEQFNNSSSNLNGRT